MPKKVDEWMPFLIGRYLGDTMHLTYDQHGPYILLLMHYWRTGPLPDDDRKLAAITRVPLDTWKSDMAETLREFFTLEADGLLHQKRADEEIARRKEISAKRSFAGKTGADVRYGEDVPVAPPVANASGLLPGCEPFATVQEQQQEQGQKKEVPPPSVGVVAEATPANVQEAYDAWNRLAAELGLPTARGLNKQRKAAIGARLRENGGITAWHEALAAIKGSAFLRGESKEGWRANLDFVCQASSFTKLLEGAYAGSRNATSPQLTLLRPIDGGKAADPNDQWGVEEWCRSIGAEPITNPDYLKRGKWMHLKHIIDSVARNVAREAGFPTSWRGDWSPLLQWIEAGCDTREHIYPAVKSSADFFRGRGNPATTLNAFTTAVMQRKSAA